jgi:hypothetical protein
MTSPLSSSFLLQAFDSPEIEDAVQRCPALCSLSRTKNKRLTNNSNLLLACGSAGVTPPGFQEKLPDRALQQSPGQAGHRSEASERTLLIWHTLRRSARETPDVMKAATLQIPLRVLYRHYSAAMWIRSSFP